MGCDVIIHENTLNKPMNMCVNHRYFKAKPIRNQLVFGATLLYFLFFLTFRDKLTHYAKESL